MSKVRVFLFFDNRLTRFSRVRIKSDIVGAAVDETDFSMSWSVAVGGRVDEDELVPPTEDDSSVVLLLEVDLVIVIFGATGRCPVVL